MKTSKIHAKNLTTIFNAMRVSLKELRDGKKKNKLNGEEWRVKVEVEADYYFDIMDVMLENMRSSVKDDWATCDNGEDRKECIPE